LTETKRGSLLIRRLRAAGGCDDLQPGTINLNQFVREKEPLLRRLIGERIRLDLHLDDALAPVFADSRALEYVLVNLILNARDAVSNGGAINLRTQTVWIDPRNNARQSNPDGRPGHFVRLTVSDNGCGMSREVQEHLFEPFFTTRKDGKALGLGLATTHGAIKQHGGWIEWTTEPDRGTELSVFLPAARLADTKPAAALESAPALTRETVLLVESNDQVRDLARHILQRNGYPVIEADSPSTASLLMETLGKNVQVLLTDLKFPQGGSGSDLADQLRQFNPKVRVVYASGPLSPDDTQPSVLEDVKILFKPYTPERLLKAIHSALGSGERVTS
jgi:two-component system cell cycle sensor histidine kinase/response regulator CckA